MKSRRRCLIRKPRRLAPKRAASAGLVLRVHAAKADEANARRRQGQGPRGGPRPKRSSRSALSQLLRLRPRPRTASSKPCAPAWTTSSARCFLSCVWKIRFCTGAALKSPGIGARSKRSKKASAWEMCCSLAAPTGRGGVECRSAVACLEGPASMTSAMLWSSSAPGHETWTTTWTSFFSSLGTSGLKTAYFIFRSARACVALDPGRVCPSFF